MPNKQPILLASVPIAQLADLVELPPRDVFDDLIAAGVRAFWHEGHKFRSVDAVQIFLQRYHLLNPLLDLEVDLTAAQIEHLAQDWGLTPDALLPLEAALPLFPAKPLRKFVGSAAEAPHTQAKRRLG